MSLKVQTTACVTMQYMCNQILQIVRIEMQKLLLSFCVNEMFLFVMCCICDNIVSCYNKKSESIIFYENINSFVYNNKKFPQ